MPNASSEWIRWRRRRSSIDCCCADDRCRGSRLGPQALSTERYGIFGGRRQVSEALEIPTCAGETYYRVASFRPLVEGRCVDIVMVDQDLGLSGALKVAHMAEIYGLKVVPHLATEILAHLIAAIPNGLTVE